MNTKTIQPYEELERRWAETNRLDPAGMVACSSGTAALHLALEALGLPFGSEVLVPDYTMIACPRAVTLAGLTPVFVDCDDRLNMGWDAFCQYRNSTAKVLMAVHVYGRKFDHGLIESARDFHHLVIEDLAEAHGIPPHPETDAACWSFYRNKVVAGEEGGAVWFRDRGHAKIARELRSLGFTDAHDFQHRPRGHNYRLANCLAEKVLASLDRMTVNLMDRMASETAYDLACPAGWRMPGREVPWVFDLRIPELTREKQKEIVNALNARGIAARMGFYPCSLQREYQWSQFVSVGPPNSCLAMMEVFYLPLLPGSAKTPLRGPVTLEEATSTFDVIREVLGKGTKEVAPTAG